MSDELKPCPFCNAKVNDHSTNYSRENVVAHSCELFSGEELYGLVDEWNSAYCWQELAKWKALAGELADFLDDSIGMAGPYVCFDAKKTEEVLTKAHVMLGEK